MTLVLFDIFLCAILAVLAWTAIRSSDPFRGIVLFMVFGLFMALAWTRLHAPDLALTEAALGAGFLGALFLATLGRIEARAHAPVEDDTRQGRATAALSLALIAAVFAFLAASGLVPQWREPTPGLTAAVLESLEQTGVRSPVTAVILNYRAYDTLLELAVLILTLAGVQALRPLSATQDDTPSPPAPDPALAAYARLLVPLLLLVGAYLLWAGGHRPGGAFQAGSILAGMGVLLILAGLMPVPNLQRRAIRAGITIGILVFAACGLAVVPAGYRFLQWPPPLAKGIIVVIETAGTLSIALCLLGLFAACTARDDDAPEARS